MTPSQQETLYNLGRNFEASFAQWCSDNADELSKMAMAAGSLGGIKAGMKQTLLSVLESQASTDVPPPSLPLH
jgi:hypothetical protein